MFLRLYKYHSIAISRKACSIGLSAGCNIKEATKCVLRSKSLCNVGKHFRKINKYLYIPPSAHKNEI